MKNYIEQAEADPRLPTDTKYVAVNALAERYQASRESLLRFAIKNPRRAQRYDGNPWTETDDSGTLFLHEPSVADKFARA
jgi:hypothetical protein